MTKPADLSTVFKNTAGISFIAGCVGYLGAYLVKPYLVTVSSLGVGFSLGLTPALGLGIAAAMAHSKSTRSSNDFEAEREIVVTIHSLFFAAIAGYCLSVVMTNLAFRVHLLHPVVGFMTGGIALGLSGGTVFAVAYIFSAAHKYIW